MNEAPIPVLTLSEKDKARFLSKRPESGPLPDQSNPHYAGIGECWNWIGTLDHNRYGVFYLQGKNYKAHRLAFFLEHGCFPAKGNACHICDNPRCARPSHLFNGNHKDNLSDAASKGRMASGARHGSVTMPHRVPRGDKNGSRTHPERLACGDASGARKHPEKMRRGDNHPTRRLHSSDVIAIRKRYAAGGISQRKLSVEYQVHEETIYALLHRKTWKHLPI